MQKIEQQKTIVSSDYFDGTHQWVMGTKLSNDDERHTTLSILQNMWDKRDKSEACYMWCDGYNRFRKGEPIPWKIESVEGKIDVDVFFKMILKKRFPVNIQLRHRDNLTYCYLRDNWHDSIGHVPYLYNKQYTDTLRVIALTYCSASSERVKKTIERLYWAIIEFGLIGVYDRYQILGAGLISSDDEWTLAMSNTYNTVRDFDIEEIANWDYDSYGVQDRHYLIPGIGFFREEIEKYFLF